MYPPKCTSIHTHTQINTHTYNNNKPHIDSAGIHAWSLMRGSVLLGGQFTKIFLLQRCKIFLQFLLQLLKFIEWMNSSYSSILFVLEEFVFASKLGYQNRINSVLKLYQPTPCKDKCTSIRRNLQNDTKYTFKSFMSQPLNFSLADQQVSLKRFILD